MILSSLLALIAATIIQVQHRQVPVVTDRDVAVASVTVPEGITPEWQFAVSGLPAGALRGAYVRNGWVYVNVDGRRIKDLTRPFRLTVSARGAEVRNTGVQEHRLARKVRTRGDGGVQAYRIPGLVTSGKGTLIATYDIRRNSSRDLQEDIDVGISRSTDGGLTWGPMIIAMDMGEWGGLPENVNGIGDPCILVDEVTGDILLFAAWTHGGTAGEAAWWSAGSGFDPASTPQLMMVRSTDDGLTWSPPVNLTRQVKQESWHFTFQGPGRGITMADGTLVVPFQHQEPDRTPAAGIMYSKDRGATWQVHAYAKINTTESQVAEVEPGVLMLNMRDNRGTGRAVYVTRDLGKTWEPHVSDAALVEPVCMASLLKAGNLLLFSNPADPKVRRNITVRVSEDGGVTWPREILLDEGTGWGYSCLSMIDSDTVGILYESSQAHMTFQAVKLRDIR